MCGGRSTDVQASRGSDQLHSLWTEPAHAQEVRTGARGNVTLFPMPLRDVAEELARVDTPGRLQLPHTAAQVHPVYKVLLKSSGNLPGSAIAYGKVRRQVVLFLIEDMHLRKHPSYAQVGFFYEPTFVYRVVAKHLQLIPI
jgi:hypothetical protein